jgi:hypothetical protein
MKKKLIFTLIILVFFTSACFTTKSSPEKNQAVTQKIQSKDFTIVVNYAYPMRGRQIYLNSVYDLRIKNDSAFAFLPFFGVAYVISYGSDGGIKFDEPVNDYSISNNKKSNGWDIHFKIKSVEDTYEIYINIFENGRSSITVNSMNKDAITYDGEVKK